MILLSEFSASEIGLTAFCLLFVIKQLFDLLKNKGGQKDIETIILKFNSLDEMKSQTKDLHEWHNKDDEDGRKIWYVKASFEANIKENTQAIRALQQTIQALDS